ncbi:MAG: cation:proton antiporter [Proteobacteria bacterium]|nr:cation:proton antiporter [Pseudomonadota bacterium]
MLRLLAARGETATATGRAAVGLLIFQDLAVVPFIILIASLSGEGSGVLWQDLGLALVKAIAVLAVVFALGRLVLRPVFHEIAKSRSPELFTLAVLLFTLAAAWTTHAFGLSLALGAFVAGMMLGETEFRHQVEADIRPFRDMLLGLFFVTIGMLVDIEQLEPVLPYVLAGGVGLVIFKLATVTLLSRMVTTDWNASFRAGLVLAQGGEFGFALLTLALAVGLLPPELAQIALGSILLSMLASPLLIRYNETIAHRFMPKDNEAREKAKLEHDVSAHHIQARDHVIIVGYGRVGQNLARFLEREGFEFVALDLDPYRVRSARAAGDPVYFGDGTHHDVLQAAGIAHAKVLVQTYFGFETSMRVLEQVKAVRPDLPVLIRTRDDINLDTLQAAGATEIVPETLEASLMMAAHVLTLLGVPVRRILRDIQEVRAHRYDMLRSVFRRRDAQWIDTSHSLREQLSTVEPHAGDYAIGKRLDELKLDDFNVSVTGVRRDGILGRQPGPETEVREHDTLILFGTPEDLERAEDRLMKG